MVLQHIATLCIKFTRESDNVVSITLRAEWLEKPGSILAICKQFFSFMNRPDRHWGPLSGYKGLLTRRKMNAICLQGLSRDKFIYFYPNLCTQTRWFFTEFSSAFPVLFNAL